MFPSAVYPATVSLGSQFLCEISIDIQTNLFITLCLRQIQKRIRKQHHGRVKFNLIQTNRIANFMATGFYPFRLIRQLLYLDFIAVVAQQYALIYLLLKIANITEKHNRYNTF